MKLLLDIHTHTLASGHAYGTIREMINGCSYWVSVSMRQGYQGRSIHFIIII